MITFSEKDKKQIIERGSTPEKVAEQFAYFEKGFPYINLDRPAIADDGIIRFSEKEIEGLLNAYPAFLSDNKVTKFVPASGAASRMFQPLFSFLENDDEKTKNDALKFLSRLQDFAFYDDLKQTMNKSGHNLEEKIKAEDYKTVIRFILFEEGLNYGSLPKGLLKFHQYPEYNRLAIEEHLVEAALYGQCKDGSCNIHFTVSPHHLELFKKCVDEIKDSYEKQYNVKYNVSFSIQNPATDTLAATLENEPFRDNQANLLFRPGGHGALIGNLMNLDADIVFVKNIDNVTKEEKITPTVVCKKILAAMLLEIRYRIFSYLKKIDEDYTIDLQKEIIRFMSLFFKQDVKENITVDELKKILNRPIRVCGMVKNEGEPGGGPFWVRDNEGKESLQIVESSQINPNDSAQQNIVKNATHFNPVDMVCSIKDYNGNHFEPADFIDNNTGFISEKSYGDRKLKAMELPGLWNGAMAGWLTLFVEVSPETFNPVKTVFDLLRR